MLREEATREKWAVAAGIVLAVFCAMFAGDHGRIARADEPPAMFPDPFDPKNWPKDPPGPTRQVKMPWQVWGQFDGREVRGSGIAVATIPAAEGETVAPPEEGSPGEYTSTPQPVKLRSGRQAIEKALRQPISLEFEDVSLDEFARFLQKLTGVPIVLDRRALKEVRGIDPDQTVTTLRVTDISLQSALRIVLPQLELDYTVAADFSMITIEPKGSGRFFTRAYPVADLVVWRDPSGAKVADFDTLEKLITICVSPGWGDAFNIPGSLTGSLSHHEITLSLVAATNGRGHAEIASLLAGLREAARQSARGSLKPVPLTERLPNEEKIREALRRKVTLRYENRPLDALVEELAERFGINIVFDRLELEQVLGIVPSQQLITCDLPEMSLGSALRSVLSQIEATYQIENECLVITTQEKADQILSPWLYPVGDLTAGPQGSNGHHRDLKTLEELVARYVGRESWQRVGGPGTTMTVRLAGMTAIFAWQMGEVHEEIGEFLDGLRRAVGQSAQGDMTPVPLDRISQMAEKFRKALDRKITLHLENTPLKEAVRQLSKLSGVNFIFDRTEIEQVLGIGPDEPVSIDVTDLPLERVLNRILAQLELMWWIEDEYILITTCEKSDQMLTVWFYPVRDLVAKKGTGVFFAKHPPGRSGKRLPSPFSRDLDALAKLVSTVVAPESWEAVGGPGDLAPVEVAATNAILVRQTTEVQEEVAEFFNALRQAVRQSARGDMTPVPLDRILPMEKKFRKALDRKITLHLEDTPLKEAVRQLSQLTGVRFEFDQREIEQVLGFGPELPVSIDVTEVSLERVLRRILSRIELAWVIEDEYVLITTRGNWCQAATVTLYPADDLVSAKKGEDRSGRNLDELAELISTVVRPESWGEMGGPGATAPIEVAGANVIVIRQTRDAHEELAQFFALLRRAARQSAAEESFSAVCPSPEEEKFRRLLRRKVTLHVESEPLEAVARQLEKTTGVGMELDELEIKQVLNLDPDVPVSIDVTDVPLDRALDRMLMPLELTWVMAGEYILITSVEKADQMLTIRLYPVGDLVEPREHVRRADWDFDSLCNILTGSVCPHTWEEVGGPGTMMSTQLGGLNALAVRQTRKPHEETAATLAALREAVRQSAAGSLTPVQLAPEAHGEKKIRQQLRRKVTIDIQKEPLQEAIKKLRAVTDIDIVVDYAETRSVLGIDHDDPVSIASVDQPLGSALRRSLHPLDLTWIIEDERLVITTREKADQTLLYRLYPVRDLVSPGGIADPAGYDFESLTEAITTCIRPESWSEGKPYLPSVEIGGMAALLIEQTAEVHEEIAALLDKLRAAGEKKE